MTTDYPAFEPPSSVPRGPASAWSREEAEAYFAWLMEAREGRVAQLLGALGVPAGEPEDLLAKAGERAAELIRGFNRGIELTVPGARAVAADMGLLVARSLCEARDTIHWQIVRRPPRDVDYNLPALYGFGRLHMDPIGGSLVSTMGLLRGRYDARVWLQIFEDWLALAGPL